MAKKREDKQNNQNIFDFNRNRGGDREDAVNYKGFRPDPPPVKERAKAPRPKGKSKGIDLPPKRTKEEEDQIRLAKLLNETSMDMAEFHDLANLSLAKARDLTARIDNAVELSKIQDLRIQLRPPEKKLSEDLIGTSLIDNDAAECLVKLALDTPIKNAYEAQLDADNAFDGVSDTLDVLYNDEDIEEAFPDLGFKLIIMVVKIAHEVIVKSILGGICKALQSILKALIVTVPLVPVVKEVINLLGKALLLDKEVEVCGEQEGFDLQKEVQDLVNKQRDKINPDFDDPFSGGDPPNRCDEGYKPTNADRIAAQRILDAAIAIENKAITKQIMRENDLDNDPNKVANNFSLSKLLNLRKTQGEIVQYTVTGEAILMKTAPAPGIFVADKAEAELLGFFANLNSLAQRIDAKVSGIIALEFMDKDFKEWICCLVRLFYLVIPRFMEGTTKSQIPVKNPRTGEEEMQVQINPPKKYKEAQQFFNEGVFGLAGDEDPEVDKQKKESLEKYKRGQLTVDDLEGSEAFEEAKKWLIFLDAVLALLFGTMSIDLNLNLNIFKADFLKGTLKVAIAEAGSVIMTAIHHKVDDAIFKIVREMQLKLPDVKLAMEMCKPFNWFFNALQCSLQGFFTKFHEILAQLWIDGKKVTDDVESSLTVSVSNKSLDFFRKLLEIMINWDMAIINFCALNMTTTEAERREIFGRVVDSTVSEMFKKTTNPSVTAKQERFNELVANLAPAFHPNVNLSLDGSDPYASDTSGVNPLVRDRRTIHLQLLGQDPSLSAGVDEETGEPKKPEIATPKKDSPEGAFAEMVKSCGDEFKGLLRDRYKDIEEIHKSIFNT